MYMLKHKDPWLCVHMKTRMSYTIPPSWLLFNLWKNISLKTLQVIQLSYERKSFHHKKKKNPALTLLKKVIQIE